MIKPFLGHGFGGRSRWLLALVTAFGITAPAAAQSFDLLIVNGTVYDGTGSAPQRANVGVKDGKIVAVGALATGSARRRIDASGLAVAPGFIDAHTHVAEAVAKVPGPFLTPQLLTQGVTTMLIGADGGFSPNELRQIIRSLIEKGSGTNYGCYIGHNGIRTEVLGKAHRTATRSELNQMRELVREGMRLGCVGLSAGLMYDPGMFSGPDEIIALAREVRPFGGIYDAHSRHPVIEFMSAETETIDIGASAGIPAKLGHLKAVGLVNEGRSAEIVAAVEAARKLGREVVADMYPYDGAATGLLHEVLMFREDISRDPTKPPSLLEVQARLRKIAADPAAVAELKDATENGIDGGFAWGKAVGYGSMRVIDAPGRSELVGQNLELLARERNVDPFALLVALVSGGGDMTITVGSMAEKDVQNLMRQPWMMIASDGFYTGTDSRSDSGGHPRSTGTFTRVLGRYVRDVGLFSLEEAIRRMTSLPAEHLNMRDRGRIAPGFAADIVVFDPEKVADQSTYKEPNRFSSGIIDVIVNGRLALIGGKLTGEAAGKFVPRETASR